MDDDTTPATKGDLQTVQGDLQVVKGDLQTVKGDLQVVKGDLQVVQGDLQAVKSDLRRLEQFVREGFARIDDRFSNMHEDIDRVLSILVKNKETMDDHGKRIVRLEKAAA